MKSEDGQEENERDKHRDISDSNLILSGVKGVQCCSRKDYKVEEHNGFNNVNC